MNSTKHLLTSFILGLSFFSFSQYEYSIEVEDFKNKNPKTVFDEVSHYLDDHSRYIKDGKFTFQSESLYSLEKINHIVNISGYSLKNFTILSTKEEEKLLERKK